MNLWDDSKFLSKKVAIYGLSTETERLISRWGDGPDIIGLLDGFKESGEMYGYPIISLQQAFDRGVELILVVARPGSCKVIAKRIKEACLANGVEAFDLRGNNLLEERQIRYDFATADSYKRQELLRAIDEAEVVSFDLFDTLLARKVFYYTDAFELLDSKLRKSNVCIPEFASKRIAAEKELSVDTAPNLQEIYKKVLENENPNCFDASELAKREFELDSSLLFLREDMMNLVEYAADRGKIVVVTSDSYYSRKQIEDLIEQNGIRLVDNFFISCEYGKSKADGLFEELKNCYPDKVILHIGDDLYVDVEKATEYDIESFRIYSAKDLFETLGGFGFESNISCYSDKTKAGLMLSKLFSSPFQFEDNNLNIRISDAKDIGYCLCGPLVLDFALWFGNKVREVCADNILLCARDGYLLKKILVKINELQQDKYVYFLTSRTAAIRAGIENTDDLAYVDSMKYFGTDDANLNARFGICLKPGEDRTLAIMKKAREQRLNYKKYIDELRLSERKTVVFDFVAKGTTQLFLTKLLPQELIGLYFLQLEPEFMADKGLVIESFYTEEERDQSAIFDNYYILETILTSPMPSLDEFDENGKPVYAKETRTDDNLSCVARMQEGILDFVDDYLAFVPDDMRRINKKIDESMLSLITKLEITDEAFRRLTVEDPFFGRMTKIVDVI